MAGFDAKFELEVSLPLAQAAYNAANGAPLNLPDGFTLVAEIRADTHKAQAFALSATSSQKALLQAMAHNTLNPSIFGLIAANGTTVAVCFRGTQTVHDWLANFDFLHAPYALIDGFGNVHQGFQFVYQSVRSSVHATLDGIANRQRTLVVGHSLGGALAVLAAPDLAVNKSGGATPEVHNFASPRVAAPDDPDIFHSDFAVGFGRTIPDCTRIANRWDIVPNLPPPVTGYQHVGLGVDVDGGFTLDLARAHSLDHSYRPGLEALIPPAPRRVLQMAVR